MRLTLTGSAGPGGWPDPWCGCATCLAATPPSSATAAILDRAAGTVVLDVPAVPLGAAVLRRTGLLLLTGARPPVLSAALLGDGTGSPRPPLDVVSPAAVAGPGTHWIAASPGERPRPEVQVLPAPHRGQVAYLVAGQLLYAPAGVEPADRAPGGSAPARLALLGCPHPDEFARTVARLRVAGMVGTSTRLVAVGLTHANPPLPELRRRLALAGGELLADGSRLELPGPAEEVPLPRRVLVTGGTRSGKSEEAERRLLSTPGVVYVATGPPRLDAEWADRVAEHRRRRPASWRTVETTDLAPLLAEPGPPLLVDSLTLWLAAHLADARPAVDALVAAWRGSERSVVGVTDEVGSGVHPPTEVGRRFRDELGRLNARLAAESDEVWLVTVGLAQRLR